MRTQLFERTRLTPAPRSARLHAFTLIELMVVMAIMAVVMTIAIPSVYRRLHPGSMQKTVSDIVEAASHARARAILNGTPTDLVFNADNWTISVQPASGGTGSAPAETDPFQMAEAPRPVRSDPDSKIGFTARIPETIAIEAAEVNFFDLMELNEARVRFYPNGTCDEFRMILFRPETGERRLITVEITTGIVDVETDPTKIR